LSERIGISKLTIIALYVLITLGAIIIAVLPVIQTLIVDDWTYINEGHLGLISAASTYLSTGFGVYLGYLGDKYKRVRLTIIGSIVAALFSIIGSFSANFIQLFIFLVIASIGIGSTIPAIYSIFSDSYKPEKRASIFGYISIITGVFGAVIGAVFFVELAMINWRLPYLVLGIILLFFIPILFFLKEPPRGGKEDSLEEILEKDPSLSFQYKIKMEDIKYLWKRRTNLFLVPNLVDNIPGGILATYGVSWLVRTHGVSQDNGVILFILIGLFSLVGTIGFAKYGDRKAKTDKLIRVKLGIFLSIMAVPFIIIAVNIPWVVASDADILQILFDPMVIIVILLIGVGLALDSGIFPNWMTAITEINLPEQRSTMISLANFFDACGRGLGMLIGAIILIINPGNYTFVMSFAVLFTLLSFIWWVPAMKTYEKDFEEVKKILDHRAIELQNKVK